MVSPSRNMLLIAKMAKWPRIYDQHFQSCALKKRVFESDVGPRSQNASESSTDQFNHTNQNK